MKEQLALGRTGCSLLAMPLRVPAGAVFFAAGLAACGGLMESEPNTKKPGLGGTAGKANVEPVPNAIGGAPSHVAFAIAIANNCVLNHGILLDVDGLDRALLVSPSDPESASDPGPRLQWFSFRGELLQQQVFDQGISPEAVAIGPDNCVWMAGRLHHDASFGGPTVPELEHGYYLVKLAPDGTQLFTLAAPTVDEMWIHAIAVDAKGCAYVAGALNRTDSSNVMERLSITKYSPEGTPLYNREFQGSGFAATPSDLVIAPNGDLVVTGYYSGELDFGVTKLRSLAVATESSSYNGFLAALNAGDGSARWAQSFGGAIVDWSVSVNVTSWGSLRIAGQLTGASNMGHVSVSAAASGSAFVAELTSEGQVTWVQVLEESGVLRDANTDATGRTYAVGEFVEAQGRSSAAARSSRSFVVNVMDKTTTTFPLSVATTANGGWGIATDRSGGLWVTGYFAGTIDLGQTTLTTPVPNDDAWYFLRMEP